MASRKKLKKIAREGGYNFFAGESASLAEDQNQTQKDGC